MVDVIEGNRLIAEFMELEIVIPDYHSDWNKLLPACKKFIELSLYFVGNRSQTYSYIHYCDKLRNRICGFEIGEVFDYLVKCIAWYDALIASQKENNSKCDHEFVSREYLSQSYGTCMICGQTVFK